METTDWKDALAAKFGMAPGEEATEPASASEAGEASADDALPPRGHALPPRGQRIDIVLDRKGRHGKTATIIVPASGTEEQIAALGKQLRQQCGTGGSARGGEILLQGDFRDRAATLLQQSGYKTRKI